MPADALKHGLWEYSDEHRNRSGGPRRLSFLLPDDVASAYPQKRAQARKNPRSGPSSCHRHVYVCALVAAVLSDS